MAQANSPIAHISYLTKQAGGYQASQHKCMMAIRDCANFFESRRCGFSRGFCCCVRRCLACWSRRDGWACTAAAAAATGDSIDDASKTDTNWRCMRLLAFLCSVASAAAVTAMTCPHADGKHQKENSKQDAAHSDANLHVPRVAHVACRKGCWCRRKFMHSCAEAYMCAQCSRVAVPDELCAAE